MIVGVCGYMGSGKTRVANRLRDCHGFAVVSPIDPAKRFVGELFGFTNEQLYGPSSARDEPHAYMLRADGEPLTARYVLDELGVLLRQCYPLVLADYAMRDPERDLVNESVRFREELEFIRQRRGKLILRKGGTPQGNVYDALVNELPDSYFDAVIPRLGSLEQLHRHVDVIVDGWRSEEGR